MSRPVEVARPLLLLLAGALALALAGGAGARTTDRNQPLDVASVSNDCTIADDGPCTFSGDVHIVQGTMDVRAGRAVLHRANGDIRRVVLTGTPVQLSQELDDGSKINARAANVDYDLATDTIVFTGDAVIDQPGRGKIAGGRIAYNMKSGQVQGSGDPKQRVRMQFLPRNAGAAGGR